MIARIYAHARASSPIEHSRPHSIELIPIASASIILHRKRRLGFPVVGARRSPRTLRSFACSWEHRWLPAEATSMVTLR
jgi:hypothetical protein